MVHPGNKWSASRLGMWERCQQAFQYRYVDEIKTPPNAAMITGLTTDRTANSVYQEKLETGETASDVRERWAANWVELSEQVEDWDEDPGKLLDQGVSLVQTWRDEVAEQVQPVEVQPERTIELAGGVSFIGIADLIACSGEDFGQTYVSDLKVKSRKMSQVEADRNLQSLAYPFIFKQERMQYHVMVRSASKPAQKQIIEVDVDPHDDSLMKRVAIADRQMEVAYQTGDFYPNRSNMLCSKRWCAYADRCMKQHGGRVPE